MNLDKKNLDKKEKIKLCVRYCKITHVQHCCLGNKKHNIKQETRYTYIYTIKH